MRSKHWLVYVAAIALLICLWIGTMVFYGNTHDIDVSRWLLLLLTVTACMFYAGGRSDFLKQTKRRQIVPVLLLVFGVFLLFYGGFVSLINLDVVRFYFYEPLVLRSWSFNEIAALTSVFDIIWPSLWAIAGFTLILDWLRPPMRASVWAIIAFTSFVVFCNTNLLEINTGNPGHGLVSYLFGFTLYAAVSISTFSIALSGIALFSSTFLRKQML